MVGMTESEDKRAVIKSKLRQNFDGKIVRKDLTKRILEEILKLAQFHVLREKKIHLLLQLRKTVFQIKLQLCHPKFHIINQNWNLKK